MKPGDVERRTAIHHALPLVDTSFSVEFCKLLFHKVIKKDDGVAD